MHRSCHVPTFAKTMFGWVRGVDRTCRDTTYRWRRSVVPNCLSVCIHVGRILTKFQHFSCQFPKKNRESWWQPKSDSVESLRNFYVLFLLPNFLQRFATLDRAIFSFCGRFVEIRSLVHVIFSRWKYQDSRFDDSSPFVVDNTSFFWHSCRDSLLVFGYKDLISFQESFWIQLFNWQNGMSNQPGAFWTH